MRYRDDLLDLVPRPSKDGVEVARARFESQHDQVEAIRRGRIHGIRKESAVRQISLEMFDSDRPSSISCARGTVSLHLHL
jgi:hypothetical protein